MCISDSPRPPPPPPPPPPHPPPTLIIHRTPLLHTRHSFATLTHTPLLRHFWGTTHTPQAIKKLTATKIIVTHGTDTIVETAQFVAGALPPAGTLLYLRTHARLVLRTGTIFSAAALPHCASIYYHNLLTHMSLYAPRHTQVLGNRTVIFTGAQRPQKFYDSDASFNVGVAVGAINLLGKLLRNCDSRTHTALT
jgi:hypothetical protein